MEKQKETKVDISKYQVKKKPIIISNAQGAISASYDKSYVTVRKKYREVQELHTSGVKFFQKTEILYNNIREFAQLVKSN